MESTGFQMVLRLNFHEVNNDEFILQMTKQEEAIGVLSLVYLPERSEANWLVVQQTVATLPSR